MTSDDPQTPARTPDDSDPWVPDPDSVPSARPRRRGLFVTAVVVFAIGVIFTIAAALTPFVLGHDAPTVLYVCAMLFTPLGFLLGLLYAILGSRPPRV